MNFKEWLNENVRTPVDVSRFVQVQPGNMTGIFPMFTPLGEKIKSQRIRSDIPAKGILNLLEKTLGSTRAVIDPSSGTVMIGPAHVHAALFNKSAMIKNPPPTWYACNINFSSKKFSIEKLEGRNELALSELWKNGSKYIAKAMYNLVKANVVTGDWLVGGTTLPKIMKINDLISSSNYQPDEEEIQLNKEKMGKELEKDAISLFNPLKYQSEKERIKKAYKEKDDDPKSWFYRYAD